MPRHNRHRKYKSFGSLSRKRRNDAVMRLRRQIDHSKDDYGRLFTSDLILDDTAGPTDSSHLFDFYFLGREKGSIWNATICTAAMAFWDVASERALTEAISLLSLDEWEEESRIEFEPYEVSPTGKVLSCTMVEREPMVYPQLGNLTFRDYCAQRESDIIANHPPLIYESFKLDYSFRYGVGLYIVVDAMSITRPVIERAIQHLFELGEVEWQAEQPVPREHLPYKTEKEAWSERSMQVRN